MDRIIRSPDGEAFIVWAEADAQRSVRKIAECFGSISVLRVNQDNLSGSPGRAACCGEQSAVRAICQALSALRKPFDSPKQFTIRWIPEENLKIPVHCQLLAVWSERQRYDWERHAITRGWLWGRRFWDIGGKRRFTVGPV